MASNVQTQWARLVIDGLVGAGVTEAVISPGSRSTPFVIAALRKEKLHCVHAIDERCAAFYALGQARMSGMPSVLICTSGSAAAHYLPAVIEAYEAGVPLVVLSADRPNELKQCGANQTTEQKDFFCSHLRFFADLGLARSEDSALTAVRRVAAQAVAASIRDKGGPVHLNAPAKKPLEPIKGEGEQGTELESRVDTIIASTLTQVVQGEVEPQTLGIENIAATLSECSRPMVVCGPGPIDQSDAWPALSTFCERLNIPIFAESASQFRHREKTASLVIGSADAMFRSKAFVESWAPDFVLQLGHAPVSKGWLDFAEGNGAKRVVLSPYGWPDPTGGAQAIIVADLCRALVALDSLTLDASPFDAGIWLNPLRDLDAKIWERSKFFITDELSEASIPRLLIEALPKGTALVVGNSLPIRQLDAWCSPSDKELSVVSQRGTSGIDGMVSGAAGAASQSANPTVLFVGDVSFLHDVGGLALASMANTPLVIVVVNNEGGRIFEQLPIATTNENDLPFFTTPHRVDLGHLVKAHGIEFSKASNESNFKETLNTALALSECTVIEAKVPAGEVAILNNELWAAASELITKA